MAEHKEYHPSEDLFLLLSVVERAGEIAMHYFQKDLKVWVKQENSPVSEADYAVDEYLKKSLMALRPDYGWLSEETDCDESCFLSKKLFIVDPIDGTRGFLRGEPFWSISLSVVEKGKTLCGVLSCPAVNETYAAYKSGGSTLNGHPIFVQQSSGKGKISIEKSFFEQLLPVRKKYFKCVDNIPSLSYRLALIARGDLDAVFIKPKAKDWDLAAADLVLQEAGGQIMTASGTFPSYGLSSALDHEALLAGNGYLWEDMRVILKDYF